MSKWTKEKVLKQIKIGNFCTIEKSEGVKLVVDIFEGHITSYGYESKCLYDLFSVNNVRFYRDKNCTQEISPEPTKTQKLFKFYQYLKYTWKFVIKILQIGA